MFKALEWMVDCGMTQVLFEMDCKVIVDRVNQLFSTQDTTDLGAIILQCKYILAQYQNSRVSFVKR